MTRKANLLITMLLFSLPSVLCGQSSVWIGLRTKSKLGSDWQLATFTETRYRLNKIRPERAFTEATPTRKFNKAISIAAPVRFTAFENAPERRHEVRLGLQGILSLPIKSTFQFKYRTFPQWDKSIDQVDFQKAYWRHKFDFQKTWLDKWSSQIEQEFWHDFTCTGKIDRYRLVVSNTLKVNEGSKFYLAYLMQTPIFTGYTNVENIAVLRCLIKL